MARAPQSLVCVERLVIASDATFPAFNKGTTDQWQGSGCDAGGRIVVSSGSATLSIVDGTGRVLRASGSISATVDIAPTGAMIQAPLNIIVSGSSTFSCGVYWGVKT